VGGKSSQENEGDGERGDFVRWGTRRTTRRNGEPHRNKWENRAQQSNQTHVFWKSDMGKRKRDRKKPNESEEKSKTKLAKKQISWRRACACGINEGKDMKETILEQRGLPGKILGSDKKKKGSRGKNVKILLRGKVKEKKHAVVKRGAQSHQKNKNKQRASGQKKVLKKKGNDSSRTG